MSTWIDSLNENEWEDIYETTYEWIDEYHEECVLQMMTPTFYSDLVETVTQRFIEECLESDPMFYHTEEEKEDVQEWVESMIDDYYENGFSQVPVRSRKTTFVPTEENAETRAYIDITLSRLRSIEQPAQRTPEWYAFRHHLITASNLSKVFGSDAERNSLIYSKCKTPFANEFSGFTNTMSPLHWGQKYEPVSVAVYEKMFSTRIGDFGCIQHPQYSYIGASPDGINIDPMSERYGRMIEIKNIVNRELNGIPSKAYWIQMQIQMETCDLDECDFLETQFKEYLDEASFYDDTATEYRGVILYFIGRVGYDSVDVQNNVHPYYVYMPMNIPLEKEAIDSWVQDTRDSLRSECALYETIYWYLDDYSCILVERNQLWFSAAQPQIEDIWNTIVQERETGYEHRAAKKRASKPPDLDASFTITQLNKENSGERDTTTTLLSSWINKKSICLVKLDPEDV